MCLSLTQQPALLHLLQLLVEVRPLQDLRVLETAGPVCLGAEQQAPGVAHQLAADGVVALPVQVRVVLAVGGLDGDLEVVRARGPLRLPPSAGGADESADDAPERSLAPPALRGSPPLPGTPGKTPPYWTHL